jgi:hypothetical protein
MLVFLLALDHTVATPSAAACLSHHDIFVFVAIRFVARQLQSIN